MKKRSMLAGFAGLLASTGAHAADLGVYSKAPTPSGYDWSGFYVGGHVGGAFQSTDFNDPTSAQVAGSTNVVLGLGGLGTAQSLGFANIYNNLPGQKLNDSSFLGGFQAGANYQIGHFVIGGEFDMSWTDLKNSTTGNVPLNGFVAPQFVAIAANSVGNNFSDTETFRTKTDWIATSTARLGYARDTWLFYGKLGAAFEENSYTITHTGAVSGRNLGLGAVGFLPASGFGTAFNSTGSDIRVGWTIGAGIEWAFAGNWTAKLEYDFMDFGTKVENLNGTSMVIAALPAGFPTSSPNSASPSLNQQVSEVKFGVNYKFGQGFPF